MTGKLEVDRIQADGVLDPANSSGEKSHKQQKCESQLPSNGVRTIYSRGGYLFPWVCILSDQDTDRGAIVIHQAIDASLIVTSQREALTGVQQQIETFLNPRYRAMRECMGSISGYSFSGTTIKSEGLRPARRQEAGKIHVESDRCTQSPGGDFRNRQQPRTRSKDDTGVLASTRFRHRPPSCLPVIRVKCLSETRMGS